MTKQEHLLTIVLEECLEAAHRASKALRFGLDEMQDGQLQTNAERLTEEVADIISAYDTLIGAGLVSAPSSAQIAAKRVKIEEYLNYSKQCGTLTP